jgi:hypothetical protein
VHRQHRRKVINLGFGTFSGIRETNVTVPICWLGIWLNNRNRVAGLGREQERA